MQVNTLLCLLGTLFCCFFVAFEVEASVVLRLSDQQMTVRADRIVRAKVVSKISRWEKKDRRVYTYIKLFVLDPIKGAKSSQMLTIRLMGGTANGIGVHVPGSPVFRLGEEVLVFLEKVKQAPQFHHVMGMAYGKFHVAEDPKTKTRFLQRQLKGLSLVQKSQNGHMAIQHGSKLVRKQPLKLQVFVNQIRHYLRVELAKKKKPVVRVPTLKKTSPIRPPIDPRKSSDKPRKQ